jgi:CubicO group peptidase (beta-lactamase class C family)
MPAAEYARRYLFGPLGIGSDVLWQRDPEGNSLGGWGLSVTARQMAKLGYLYLRNGRWGGREIVPASWIAASTTKQILTGNESSSSPYGYFWWLYPQPAPARFAASGLAGQHILVWPSLDLVVAITASGLAQWSLSPLIEKYLLPAVRK